MTENVDDRYLARWNSKQQARDAAEQSQTGGDGEGPHMPDMELLKARVDTLDRRFDGLEKRLDKLDTRLDGVDVRLQAVEKLCARIDGRIDLIVQQMPKWWQAPASASVIVALIAAVLGLASHFGLVH